MERIFEVNDQVNEKVGRTNYLAVFVVFGAVVVAMSIASALLVSTHAWAVIMREDPS